MREARDHGFLLVEICATYFPKVMEARKMMVSAALAQSAERTAFNRVVGGSSPPSGGRYILIFRTHVGGKELFHHRQGMS